jgi:hypothetical protein
VATQLTTPPQAVGREPFPEALAGLAARGRLGVIAAGGLTPGERNRWAANRPDVVGLVIDALEWILLPRPISNRPTGSPGPDLDLAPTQKTRRWDSSATPRLSARRCASACPTSGTSIDR